MKNLLHKIWIYKSIILWLPWTLYFNFKKLPFNQAIKLPVIFFKPYFGTLKGNIVIVGVVKFGLIKIGVHMVNIYHNNGVRFSNSGTIIFRGHCNIGSGSGISVGEKGVLTIGHNFQATQGLKLVCYNNITFGDNVLIGWDNLFTDTHFHNIVDMKGNIVGNMSSKIYVGSNCWFGAKCSTMPGCSIPDNSIIASNSLCNKEYKEKFCLYAGSPATIKRTGVWHPYEY